MKKGKLIVIEGNDGSGKGTQLRLLLQNLKKRQIPHESFDFPQYEKTFFGEFVGHFLNGKFGHTSRINPYLAMFPYAGDRWQTKEQIYKALNAGKLVICNRYAPSIAYQLAKVPPKEKVSFLKWAEKLEYEVFGIPHEDLVIFLYVPFYIAHRLIEQKEQRSYLKDKARDQYEENASYLKRVEKMYLWLNRNKKNWVIINCVQRGKLLQPQIIHKKILRIVASYF
jgi:dTMP kinase